MKLKKESLGGLTAALIELVVGVLLLINPTGFTTGIIVGLGVLLALWGAMSTAQYFMAKPEEAAREQGLAKGLVLLMAGLACVLCSDWLVSAFPLLTVLYGILLLLLSALKIQGAVDMMRLKKDNWVFAAGGALVCVVAALFTLLNPFGVRRLVWALVSVALIAEAVLDAFAVFFRKKAKDAAPKPEK